MFQIFDECDLLRMNFHYHYGSDFQKKNHVIWIIQWKFQKQLSRAMDYPTISNETSETPCCMNNHEINCTVALDKWNHFMIQYIRSHVEQSRTRLRVPHNKNVTSKQILQLQSSTAVNVHNSFKNETLPDDVLYTMLY